MEFISGTTVDYNDSIFFAYHDRDYELCVSYLDLLNETDTLSMRSIDYIALSFIRLEKYDDCINFCKLYGPNYPALYDMGQWDNKLGECYFYKGDNDAALKHLSKYIDFTKIMGISPKTMYLGMYAETLYNLHMYVDADSIYEKYFDIMFEEDSVGWDNMFYGEWISIYGYDLYRYAYNSIYLGNEQKGKELLNLSRKCGYQKAIDDCYYLDKFPYFGLNISQAKIKSSTISSFEADISKYDLKKYIDEADINTPMDFWNVVSNHSKGVNELKKALAKQKLPKSLSAAIKEVGSSKGVMNNILLRCNPYIAEEFESDIQKTLYGESHHLDDYRIFPEDEPNAFATPYGQIYLTEGLVDRFHYDKNLTLAVSAHEATHYEFQHTLVEKWKDLENKKKNEIMAGVLSGLYAGIMVASGMSMASNGVELDDSYWQNTAKISTSLLDVFDDNSFYFKFKYSRGQEIESDIMAYRFCETMGIGGYAYIMALMLLGDSFYLEADKTDDHPTTAYRALLLKYLYEKEHSNVTKKKNKPSRQF